ncbi:MAG: ABC transporter permease [Oscillospiraceae bacterium]|nr:ABC transporter permease [Oscillospiraceae bacterium]
MSDMTYEKIPAEQFTFVQEHEKIHDKELQTKARGFFADAMLRFSKNKSSVIASWILLAMVLYAVFAPIISPYSVWDKDNIYVNYPPYLSSVAQMNIGLMDGAKNYKGQNESSMLYWKAIAQETGMNPLIRITDTHETQVKQKGQTVTRYTYDIEVNAYYALGMMYRNFTYSEYERLQNWQNETGIQVIYPYVDMADIGGSIDTTKAPNIWYVVDNSGGAVLDANGEFIPVYSKNVAGAGAPYHSLRIPGDDGSYAYSTAKAGQVQCRILYYNYYRYINNGLEPTYIMGTNVAGQDIFCGIGAGARFSLLFAVLVSVINLTIGAIYGALQGYYGGWVDMLLDRIADILYDVPFVVVTTLFQLHLASRVGVVPAFLFAFVLTGWIGMASLTRRQFYRFKGQEFVLAARTLGASDRRLMFKHIFPNGIGSIITSCALVIPGVINSETSMTYLGIVDLSSFAGTTIGTLLSQGNAVVTSAPHAILFPSIFLGLLMICFNLFGNGLRDAFNPTTKGEG